MKKLSSLILVALIGFSATAFAQLSDKQEQEYLNVPAIIATDDAQSSQVQGQSNDQHPQDHLTKKIIQNSL